MEYNRPGIRKERALSGKGNPKMRKDKPLTGKDSVDEEEAIRRITKLLERGCTMLASHHDCGAPLFRCGGEVVCPVCSFEKAEAPSSGTAERSGPATPREVVGEGDRLAELAQGKGPKRGEGEEAKLAQRAGQGALAENIGLKESPSKVTAVAQEEVRPRDDLRVVEAYLRDSLLRRLRALVEEMEREQDLDRLRKQLECIEGLVRVFKVVEG